MQLDNAPIATVDVEVAAAEKKKIRRRNWLIVAAIVAGIVFNAILYEVLDRTLFKVRHPKYRVSNININIENLIANNSTNSPSFLMNLDAEITFKNGNFGKYRFEFGYLTFSYAGSQVGEASVEGASVKMYSSKSMNLKVNVTSQAVANKSNLLPDIVSDKVTLKVDSELRGQVLLMNVLARDRAVKLDCSFTVSLANKSVHDLACV